ncbi:AMIN-like domain-containing (lipo)protein [Prauserella muralis]|uniref:AMIN-like domain-containing (lipo)protein n=1 Tax=Prauserella muralis TaxID=588067 RepID=UPI000DD3F1C6|nr:hypothetical protein [Prauserella muralis]
MRRTTALAALTIALAVTVTACSGGDQAGPPGPPSVPSATTATTSPPSSAPSPQPTATSPAVTRPPAPAQCPETRNWTTAPDTEAGWSREALYRVRAGRHACFDRVVFDINGPSPVGFDVRYVPVPTADGSGHPIPVAGGAALQVVVRTPPQGFDEQGHQPGRILARTGDHFYTPHQLAGWRTLREVRFGGFFEGQCSFAVGVRAKLPMRAFTVLAGRDQVRRVVVDIAHSQGGSS